VARDPKATPSNRDWAKKLEAKPKYVVSTTRRDFPWSNTHHVDGDLTRAVKALKKATPRGLLVGSPKLSAALQRLDLVDEYRFVVHPVVAGHGPFLFSGLQPSLLLISWPRHGSNRASWRCTIAGASGFKHIGNAVWFGVTANALNRTSEYVRSMSALPPKADIRTQPRSFGPLGRAPDETGHRPAEAESCREAGENFRVTTFVLSPGSMLKCP
jgi:hypothetical protein